MAVIPIKQKKNKERKPFHKTVPQLTSIYNSDRYKQLIYLSCGLDQFVRRQELQHLAVVTGFPSVPFYMFQLFSVSPDLLCNMPTCIEAGYACLSFCTPSNHGESCLHFLLPGVIQLFLALLYGLCMLRYTFVSGYPQHADLSMLSNQSIICMGYPEPLPFLYQYTQFLLYTSFPVVTMFKVPVEVANGAVTMATVCGNFIFEYIC